jgi:hypothetical protein
MADEEKRIRVHVNAHEETFYTPEGWGNADTVVRVIFSNATFAEKSHLVPELMSSIWNFSLKNNLSPVIEVPSYPDLPPVDTLKNFGKSGDLIKGNYEDAIFVKKYRGMFERVDEYDKKVDEIMDEQELKHPKEINESEIKESMIKKYGEEEGLKLYEYYDKTSEGRPSWECRDCIVLTDNEYLKIRNRKEDSKLRPLR